MCGIFAVSGQTDQAGDWVLGGLKKLEYRGYDSWGIAHRETDQTVVRKDTGKIKDVQLDFPKTAEALGHTRWATHGGVTQANAHPHQAGSVTLVHNGIFENYAETKTNFISQGINFASETDSEVIAALLDQLLAQGLSPVEAIQQATHQIEGRFSILVLFDGHPGIYAARRGSPLIIGRGEQATFIASDIPALLEHTNVVNYLDDHEMVHITPNGAEFRSIETGEVIEKRNVEVPWTVEEADKGDYQHFMIKEIFDQKETVASAIDHEDDQLQAAARLLQSADGVYFVACGTAHKAAMAAEYFFAEITRRKINVVPASEMPVFERFVNEKTALIAVSQSGETADVMEILERGQAKGAKVLALTNVESSSMARLADVHLPINAGPEKSVASTKAMTAQMALLFLLAYADAGRPNVGRQILRSTSSAINDLLNPRYEDWIRSLAAKIVDQDNLFIIGRHTLFPMALEAAIKIQEVSYIHAQGFAAGEIKHGPIALIEDGVPCLVLGDDSETISNAIELKSRGGRIIGVAPTKADVYDEWMRVPDCDGAQAIASIVPVQILAYHLATLRGVDPDMPRNLAKSVTVK